MSKIRGVYAGIRDFRYTAAILLTVIVAVQLTVMSFMFFDQRTSYDCDEIYSYGLSNSFYRPYIESDSVGSAPLYNVNEWFSADLYRDYLTVQDGQRFRYDSVWYNQSMDRHPPLYYACLHTICSFFPDTFSFLFGFILNLVLFAVMQVFMYKFGKNLLRSKYASLMMCLVFGFTPFVLNMTIFIRMYLMLTMFTVMLLYYHSRLIKLDRTDIKKWKLFLPVFLVTFGGAMTQYLFLFGAFVIAVCFCLRYLIQKRFKLLLIYGLSMLAGVLVSFAVYPAAVRELFGEVGGAVGVLFGKQIVIALRHLFSGNYGWGTTNIFWYITVVPAILLFVLLFSAPVIFMLRDRPVIKKTLGKLRSIPKRIKSCGIKGFFGKIKTCDPMPAIMLLMVGVITAVVSYTVRFFLGFAQRYLFITAPMMCAVLFSLVYLLFRRFRARKVLVTLFAAFMLFTLSDDYYVYSFFTFSNEINLQETVKDKDVLVLTIDIDITSDNRSVYAYEFFEAKNVFFSTYLQYEKYIDDIVSADHGTELYVMLSHSNKGKDEKGEYILTNTTGIDKQEDRVYIDEFFEKFSAKGRAEYVGEYIFVEGGFLVYRFV